MIGRSGWVPLMCCTMECASAIRVAAVIASGMSQDSFVQATLLIDITGVVMAVHKFD